MADAKLRAIITVANKASGPLRAINSDLNKMRSPIRNLTRQVKGLDRASGFKELRKATSGLAGQLAKLSIVGVGAAAGVFAAINKASEAGDEIIKTATAVGMSTDALQEWRFVAERSGVSVATMNKSMQAFSKRLAEARNGTGELYGLLSKKSPLLLKQVLAVDNNTDAYAMMINAMSKLPDQQRKILLGDKAFSEAGRELVKVSVMSAEELSNLKKEGRDLGAVLGHESLKRSEAFQDSLTNLTKVAGKISFTFVSELMPAVQGIMVETQAWMQSLDREKIKEFAKSAAAGIKELAGWIKEIAPGVKQFIDNIGGLKTVAAGLGLVLAGPLLSAVVSLGAALTATPLGLLISGSAVLVVLGKKLYDEWEPFWNLIESLKTGFKSLLANARAIGEAIGGFAFNLFGDDDSIFGGNNSQKRPPAVSKKLIKAASAARTKSNVIPIAKGKIRPPAVPKQLVEAANLLRPNSNVSPFTKNDSNNERGYKYKPFKKNNLLSPKSNPTQKIVNEIGGKVVIDVRGNAKVASVKSNNPDVPLDVYSGISLVGGL